MAQSIFQEDPFPRGFESSLKPLDVARNLVNAENDTLLELSCSKTQGHTQHCIDPIFSIAANRLNRFAAYDLMPIDHGPTLDASI